MRAPADGSSVARLAALLAEPTRATMCLALLDGAAWTAGELGSAAGVARSTASEHLDLLVAGGLLTEERQGRHRYLRLASSGAAQLVESLAAHAGPGAPPRSLRAVTASTALARGRTCYDHLAGRLGVAVMDALVDRGLVAVRRGVAVTDEGQTWFLARGVDLDGLAAERRPLVRACLDWTERRPHLAGAAGAALCARWLADGWVARGGGRAVEVTAAGHRALRRHLGLTAADLALGRALSPHR